MVGGLINSCWSIAGWVVLIDRLMNLTRVYDERHIRHPSDLHNAYQHYRPAYSIEAESDMYIAKCEMLATWAWYTEATSLPNTPGRLRVHRHITGS